jgi:N-methylhydantoinase A
VEELGAQARAELGEAEPEAELRATYELRYVGQAFELPVGGSTSAQPDELRTEFEKLHEERYGYHDAEQELELVTIRVSATVPGADVSLGQAGDSGALERGRRTARLDGSEVELEVLRGSPAAATEIKGPAVVELPESTLLVPAGWSGEVDDQGTIQLSRLAPTQLENRPEGDSPGTIG